MDYQGIKIYDKVIIVERTSVTEGGYNWRGRTVNQGYVVDINNKKMLDTALNWAEWTKYDESLREKYWDVRHKAGHETEEAKAIWEEYQKTREDIKGVVHEYQNGQFEITLDEAAGHSSQGGKLSFWNCVIKAPDGKVFLIGINSELLLHLMMKTTLVNGTCQEKVWLGRIKGTQVGVFTPDMEEFEQAKEDEKARNIKKTKTYKPGDIVETLTTKELYIGEVYLYANSFTKTDRRYDSETVVKVFNKPTKMYAYVDMSWEGTRYDNEEGHRGHSISLKANKTARTVTGSNIELAQFYMALISNFKDKYKDLRNEPKGHTEWDKPEPFSHFISNMAIRTSDSFKQEEIMKDLQDAFEYEYQHADQEMKNYKRHKYFFIKESDARAESYQYPEHSWYEFTYFSNYNTYFREVK